MALLIEDFVNRDAQLSTLWKIARQEAKHRIVLIYGPDGMGKTYLLGEFRAECEAEGINCACIDFAEGSDYGYMTIVLDVRNQLGPEGFGYLTQAIRESCSYGAWETVLTPSVPARIERSAADTVPPGGRSGGIDFYGPTTVYGDVAARDIIHITQIIQRDDPRVQQVIQADITAAFQDCLIQLTKTCRVVFLLDSWERATTDIRDWLYRNLLRWIFDKKLTNAVAVVAGSEMPDLHWPPRRIGRLTLAGLPDEAVQTYWVEKCGLPLEDVPYVIKFSNREPYLMALMADRQLVV